MTHAPTQTRRLALITGAGSGIGRALAVQAAKEGYDTLLVGRRIAPLQETAALIDGPSARVLAADITTAEGRAAIVDAVGTRLDVLVNNAGTLAVGRFTDLTDAELSGMLATNLAAPILISRDLVPALAEAQGRIVIIGSMFGHVGFPYFSAYSATKFGLRGLADALGRELAEFGISLTYAAPRATRTAAQGTFGHLVDPMGMVLDDPDAVAARVWAGIAAGRARIYPGLAERIFAVLAVAAPALIDKALVKKAGSLATQAALRPNLQTQKA